MQSAGSGGEGDMLAIPETCAAIHAFFAVECGYTTRTWGYCLPGAHLDADLRRAVFADIRAQEREVIRQPGRRLNLATH